MILFTFGTTPEPQMFNGHLDRLKDKLEIYYMKLILQKLTRRHVKQLKIWVEEEIPELEARSHTTARNTGQSSQTNSTTSSDTSSYPVQSLRAPIPFADEDWN